jgi:hypothetical protein
LDKVERQDEAKIWFDLEGSIKPARKLAHVFPREGNEFRGNRERMKAQAAGRLKLGCRRNIYHGRRYQLEDTVA